MEIRQQADNMNKIAHDFEHTYIKLENLADSDVKIPLLFCHQCSESSGQELVAEMVYSFLLPEVEKETMRRRGKHTQYLLTSMPH